jgi:hypothetical protein
MGMSLIVTIGVTPPAVIRGSCDLHRFVGLATSGLPRRPNARGPAVAGHFPLAYQGSSSLSRPPVLRLDQPYLSERRAARWTRRYSRVVVLVGGHVAEEVPRLVPSAESRRTMQPV